MFQVIRAQIPSLTKSCSSTLVVLPSLRLLFPPRSDPLQYIFPVLVKLQFCDDDFAGVDADRHALAIGFLARYPLDVDDIFQAIDGGDGAFAAFVGAADYGNFVVFADWDCADLVDGKVSIRVELVPITVGDGGHGRGPSFLIR